MSVLYIVSAAACLLLCLLADRLGHRFGVIDHPDGFRKLHRDPTPLMGGIAIALPLIAAMLFPVGQGTLGLSFLALPAATLVMLVLGLFDDRAHVNVLLRLLLSFAACTAVQWLEPNFMVTGLTFPSLGLTLPFGAGTAMLFTLLCVVGLQNALNMADGKNGLAIGIMAIWSCILLYYAPPELTVIFSLLCIYLGITLLFNLFGRLFLGDAGTYSLSIAIGFLAIYCYALQAHPMPAEVPMLLFLIPVLDCLRLMARRLRARHSPFEPDREHLHHYLSRRGPWHWGLLVYLGLIALPNLIALMFPEMLLPMIVLSVLVYGGLIAALGRESEPARQTTSL